MYTSGDMFHPNHCAPDDKIQLTDCLMDRQTTYSGTPLSGHPSSADTHDIMDNSERPTVLPFISILKQPLNSGSTGSTICQAGSEANNHAMWGSNLGFVCSDQGCN